MPPDHSVVAICATCWHHDLQLRDRVTGPNREIDRCYWCGATTASRIYVHLTVQAVT